MKLYKCWFAGGLMFWPTSRKTYTFKSEEELKKGDRVIAETQNGIAVLIIASQTNLDELRNSGCDIPVKAVKLMKGLTAYCPVCSGWVGYEYRYCPTCGQRIWRKEDAEKENRTADR